METDTLATPDKKSQQRQKRLLALNAEDQQSYEKKVKKLKKKGTPGKKEAGIIYVGHLHNEFTERELRGYFGQFGHISRMRLSRSRKTGNSRGFGFIEFDDLKDAKIAAKTMDKYLMHQRLLKVGVMPADKCHADLWKGINRPWRFGAGYRSQRRTYNKARTAEKMTIIMGKRGKKDERLQAKLKDMGIKYTVPKAKAMKAKSPAKSKIPKATTAPKTAPAAAAGARRKRALPEVEQDSVEEIKKKNKK